VEEGGVKKESMTSYHAFLLIVKPGDRTSPGVLKRTALSESLKIPSNPKSRRFSPILILRDTYSAIPAIGRPIIPRATLS